MKAGGDDINRPSTCNIYQVHQQCVSMPSTQSTAVATFYKVLGNFIFGNTRWKGITKVITIHLEDDTNVWTKCHSIFLLIFKCELNIRCTCHLVAATEGRDKSRSAIQTTRGVGRGNGVICFKTYGGRGMQTAPLLLSPPPVLRKLPSFLQWKNVGCIQMYLNVP